MSTNLNKYLNVFCEKWYIKHIENTIMMYVFTAVNIGMTICD